MWQLENICCLFDNIIIFANFFAKSKKRALKSYGTRRRRRRGDGERAEWKAESI
jgi:hypothetical protein